MTSLTACAGCGAPIEPAAERCSRCGLASGAPEVPRLRWISDRYWALVADRRRLDDELARLVEERCALLRSAAQRDGMPPDRGQSLPGAAPAPRGGDTGAGGLASIRDLLVWLGAFLLVASAVGFASFEWTRLGPAGRAAALVVAVLATLAAAAGLRRRLPATAEALAVVGELLFLVDWALTEAGVVRSSMSPRAWWVVGLAASAALGVALGRLGLRTGRIVGAASVAVGLPILASLAIGLRSDVARVRPTSALAWAVVVGLELAAAHRASREATWRPAAWVLAGAAALLEAAVVLADLFGGLFALAHFGERGTTSGIVLAIAASGPAIARVLWDRDLAARPRGSRVGSVLVALSAGLVVTAVVVSTSSAVANVWLLAVLGGLGLVMLASVPVLPHALRTGVAVVSGLALAIAGLSSSWPAAVALIAPAGLWAHPFSGHLGAPAAARLGRFSARTGPATDASWDRVSATVFGVLALAGVLIARWPDGRVPQRRGRAASLLTTASATAAVLVVPLAAGLDVASSCAVLLGAATLAGAVSVAAARLGSRLATPSLVAAASVGFSAVGWCAAAPVTSLVALGAGAALAGCAAVEPRRPPAVREASGVAALVMSCAFVAVALDAAHRGVDWSVLGSVVVAGAALVLLQFVAARHRAVEAVALAGLYLPDLLLIARRDALALALGLSVATASMALSAAGATSGEPSSRRRAGYLAGSLATSVGVAWSFAASAHVHLVEAYSLPAAALVTACLLVEARPCGSDRGRRLTSSVAQLGPGLVIALGPSTVLALAEGGLVRPVCLSVTCLVGLLAGVRFGLRAPVACCSAVLALLGLDAAIPYLGAGPRWITLGAVGLVLLGVGATLERRMASVRDLVRRFRSMR